MRPAEEDRRMIVVGMTACAISGGVVGFILATVLL